MNALDWCIVIGINGAIILFGLWKSRETTRSIDWFLAAKGLPWWMVGLSMFATAVDSGDYVAVAGESYRQGFSYISAWWLGMTVGWLLVAYVVFVPMYRTGMFTNVEYLEYRFGPVARVISVLIQIQYRTNVLANVAFSLYLVFKTMTGWGEGTWWLVVGIALGAAIYTATGGLKSVAVTDSLQAVVMIIASLILWVTVWNAVGGWEGFEEKLDDEKLSGALRHIGSEIEPGFGEKSAIPREAPAALIVFGWIVILSAYCVVNHSQAMRMLASRSEWDIKMAAVLAAAVTAGMMWFNVTLGILGRAVEFAVPLTSHDQIFPKLVEEFLQPMASGLLGLVVAGLLAGGISTYDSIGSALAAVFTRDLYARFFVKKANDHHYLQVSRIATFVVIAVSFAYVPFLEGGMIKLFLALVNIGVVPLLTVYLFGIVTRVHRMSGAVGLCAGIAIGICRFASDTIAAQNGTDLPAWWANNWYGNLWAIGVTASAMILTTLIKGRATVEETQGLIYHPHEKPAAASAGVHLRRIAGTEGGWLETSQQDVPHMPQYPFPIPKTGLPWFKNPLFWSGLLVAVVSYLNLIAFW